MHPVCRRSLRRDLVEIDQDRGLDRVPAFVDQPSRHADPGAQWHIADVFFGARRVDRPEPLARGPVRCLEYQVRRLARRHFQLEAAVDAGDPQRIIRLPANRAHALAVDLGALDRLARFGRDDATAHARRLNHGLGSWFAVGYRLLGWRRYQLAVH